MRSPGMNRRNDLSPILPPPAQRSPQAERYGFVQIGCQHDNGRVQEFTNCVATVDEGEQWPVEVLRLPKETQQAILDQLSER